MHSKESLSAPSSFPTFPPLALRIKKEGTGNESRPERKCTLFEATDPESRNPGDRNPAREAPRDGKYKIRST